MLDLEAIKARLEGPGMGHLIDDVNALLEGVERLHDLYDGAEAGRVLLHRDVERLQAEVERLTVACQFAIDFLNEVDDYNAGKGQATPETVLELRGMLRRAIGG